MTKRSFTSILKNPYFILFLILCVLCYLFPYTGDDWSWGTTPMFPLFPRGNGRYFSNLIIRIITRIRFLRAILISLTILGISYLSGRITKTDLNGTMITIFSMLVVPKYTFRQAVAWSSGFVNYCMPGLFMLLTIYLFLKHYEERRYVLTWSENLLLFCLGLINSLIIEHVTLYNTLASVGMTLLLLVFRRRLQECFPMFKQLALYSISSIIGAGIMFSTPSYSRSLGDSGIFSENSVYVMDRLADLITKVRRNYFHHMMPDAFIKCYFLFAALILICTLLFFAAKKHYTKKQICIHVGSLLIMLIYMVYTNLYIKQKYDMLATGGIRLFGAVIVLLCLASFFLIIMILPIKSFQRFRLLFFYGSWLVLIFSLILLVPGPRCYFPGYLLQCVLMLEFIHVGKILSKAENLMIFNRNSQLYMVLQHTIGFILVGAFAYMFMIYGTIYIHEQARVEMLNEAKASGATEIVIAPLPHSEYIWQLHSEHAGYRDPIFKAFYGLSPDTTLIFE